MYTGKYNSKKAGKYSRKPRFSRRSILLTVSVLVLCLAMVGGTVAWITTSTAPVQNKFSIATSDITIEEEFDGQVKENIRIKNTGDVPVYVRAQIVITYKGLENTDQAGNVLPCNRNTDIQYGAQGADWETGSDSETLYYKNIVEPGEYTQPVFESIQLKEGVTPPEGYTLDVHVIAQCIQSEGTRVVGGQDVPMVIAEGWPVKIHSNGQISAITR